MLLADRLLWGDRMDCKCWKAVTASCGEEFSKEQGKKLQNEEFGLNIRKNFLWVWVVGGGSREGEVFLCYSSACPVPACWWSFPPCCAPRLGWKILKRSSRDGLDAVRPLRGCCVCPTHSGAVSRHFCSVTVLHILRKWTTVSSGGSCTAGRKRDRCCLHLRVCLCHLYLVLGILYS